MSYPTRSIPEQHADLLSKFGVDLQELLSGGLATKPATGPVLPRAESGRRVPKAQCGARPDANLLKPRGMAARHLRGRLKWHTA